MGKRERARRRQSLRESLGDGVTEEAKGRTVVTHSTLADGTEVAEIEAIPGMGVCDFCAEHAPPYHEYNPGPIRIMVFASDGSSHEDVSEDGWAACAVCERLIEGDDFVGLLDRAVEVFKRKSPAEAALLASDDGELTDLREQFRITLEAFWLAEKGVTPVPRI